MIECPPRVFLDSDIILDFCQKREFFPMAARLMQAALDHEIEALTSAGGLRDVFYLARKGCGEQKARLIIEDLMKVVKVRSLDAVMWAEALASPMKDTEDALQVACARRQAALFLVTRNIRDYRGITDPQIFPPEAMLAIIYHP